MEMTDGTVTVRPPHPDDVRCRTGRRDQGDDHGDAEAVGRLSQRVEGCAGDGETRRRDVGDGSR